MTKLNTYSEEKTKILKGLKKAYKNLLKFKKEKKSELIILQNNKIIKVKP